MKRVYCLYRVLTKKQVDRNSKNENDIPMQKTACRDFASSKQDWTILKEFSEKGVSGYKVSADDRYAIQELKEAADDAHKEPGTALEAAAGDWEDADR